MRQNNGYGGIDFKSEVILWRCEARVWVRTEILPTQR